MIEAKEVVKQPDTWPAPLGNICMTITSKTAAAQPN